MLAGRLTDSGHVLRQRVYFEDTDVSGLVYHARYLHFLERGRSDYLRLLGIGHGPLMADALFFAVRRMSIEFIRPARLDDVLSIETRNGAYGGAKIDLAQSISRDGERLIEARVVVALLGADGRPKRLPQALRAALEGRSRPTL